MKKEMIGGIAALSLVSGVCVASIPGNDEISFESIKILEDGTVTIDGKLPPKGEETISWCLGFGCDCNSKKKKA